MLDKSEEIDVNFNDAALPAVKLYDKILWDHYLDYGSPDTALLAHGFIFIFKRYSYILILTWFLTTLIESWCHRILMNDFVSLKSS